MTQVSKLVNTFIKAPYKKTMAKIDLSSLKPIPKDEVYFCQRNYFTKAEIPNLQKKLQTFLDKIVLKDVPMDNKPNVLISNLLENQAAGAIPTTNSSLIKEGVFTSPTYGKIVDIKTKKLMHLPKELEKAPAIHEENILKYWIKKYFPEQKVEIKYLNKQERLKYAKMQSGHEPKHLSQFEKMIKTVGIEKFAGDFSKAAGRNKEEIIGVKETLKKTWEPIKDIKIDPKSEEGKKALEQYSFYIKLLTKCKESKGKITSEIQKMYWNNPMEKEAYAFEKIFAKKHGLEI